MNNFVRIGFGSWTTKDWLRASEGMKLTACDPSSPPQTAASISTILSEPEKAAPPEPPKK